MSFSETHVLLAVCLAVIAFLYSSVGHAGASGYIAVMTLFGVGLQQVKTTALALNILVATITAVQFWHAGFFSWRLFGPFALLSVPMAFLGGYLNLSHAALKIVVGLVLLGSAARFLWQPRETTMANRPGLVAALLSGGCIGLLSGLTGTGGGIFLTPLMLLAGWAPTKTAAAVSAMFILVNSVAGLLGNFAATSQLHPAIGLFFVASMLGGSIGSYLGSRKFSAMWIKRLLAVVLSIAGLKLIFA